MQGLFDVSTISQLIRQGHVLVIAGTEEVLTQLPQGEWIGGVSRRFLTEEGACQESDVAYIYDFSEYIASARISTHQSYELDGLYTNHGPSTFTYVILPAFAMVHRAFSINAVTEIEHFSSPVVGWVAGVNLGGEEMSEPLVFDGTKLRMYTERMVALRGTLKEGLEASVEVLNPFVPGDGDTLVFDQPTFVVRECLINGVRRNIAEYWREINPDPGLPLVTTIRNAHVNVHPLRPLGITSLIMAASVIPNVEYRLAKPDPDFRAHFRAIAEAVSPGRIATVHCSANYDLLDLEGEKLGSLKGAFTYGEVAYVLMNQTSVNLRISKRVLSH